jgi:2',3'-cyclic-nucleotide 2'-phosphodiesterase / 3'-nucleotidase
MYQVPAVPSVMTQFDLATPAFSPPSTADNRQLHPESLRLPRASLRLIATSDLHASIMPYDYCTNRPDATRGFGGISQQIAVARSEARNSLLFDNGDFLQGNPLADYAANSPRRRRAHPVVTAFNTLCYDAVTLGNHEFDYGVPFLADALTDARFAVVSANVTTQFGKSPARDKTLFPAFTILRRQVYDTNGRPHQLRVGVIGFAPPQIEVWDRDALGGRVRLRDIIASARAWLPRLRARGADIIVALAHSGIGAADATDGMENAATALAALPEIDAVIAGHSHLAFPGPDFAACPQIDPVRGLLAGKPAVMPGHSGSHVGVIDLEIERCTRGSRRWRVVTSAARLDNCRTSPGPVPVALREVMAPDHRAALAWSRRRLGAAVLPLHTHFATVAPSAAIELIATAKTDYVRAALAGSRWADLPVLSSTAPYRCGGRGGPANFTDIGAGPLRMRNLSDLYPFPNTLTALCVTGAEIADWLERSAAVFRQILPGSIDEALHDPAMPAFAFEVIPELSYAIDLSKPARYDVQGQLVNPDSRRIIGLTHLDRPLGSDERFVLVTNNHRAARSGLLEHGSRAQIVLADTDRIQTILAKYVQRHDTVGAAPRQNWHFLPMPGTSVTFRTSPAAETHLADLAGQRVTALGRDVAGFAHYRLHL